MGLRGQGTVQRDDVRLGLNLLDLNVAAADSFEFGRVTDVESEQVAAKSSHDARKYGPDLAGPDDGHRTTDQIETHEAVELEVSFASAVVSARNSAIEREQQAHGEFGHRIWRIVGDAHNFDAKLLCRFEVDVIEAGGARCNELRPAGGETFQRVGVDRIVYEDADGR